MPGGSVPDLLAAPGTLQLGSGTDQVMAAYTRQEQTGTDQVMAIHQTSLKDGCEQLNFTRKSIVLKIQKIQSKGSEIFF